nr:MAG TPA: N-acetylmuramoyl-L-alanine amidase [Caudoviricetes sp.]
MWDELAGLGWASAVMLDGGGSSQCDFGGERITASRKVHNWICVWLKQGGQKPPEQEESMGKYTVTPSIGVNIRSGPGTSYGKVGAYPMGTVVDVLEARDGWGRTDKGWVSLTYLEAVEAPQRVTDTGLAIQTHLIAPGADNRPGGSNPCKYITIHETGNAAKGADAAAHGAYLDSAAGEDDLVSWHYTVDDHAIVQHLPDYETAYHAGDGKAGPGNTTSIGIEICVNAGGDFEAAKANAAALVRLLMEEHGISIDRVVQHNHWNGKDCPKTIRATAGAWEAFLALCRGETANVSKLDTDVDTLANVGIIDQPDYWKAGNYSKDTVEALIGKTADYVREDD